MPISTSVLLALTTATRTHLAQTMTVDSHALVMLDTVAMEFPVLMSMNVLPVQTTVTQTLPVLTLMADSLALATRGIPVTVSTAPTSMSVLLVQTTVTRTPLAQTQTDLSPVPVTLVTLATE